MIVMKMRSSSMIRQLAEGALSQIITNMQRPMHEIVEKHVKKLSPRDTMLVDIDEPDSETKVAPTTLAPPNQPEAPQVDTGYASSSLDTLNQLTGQAGKPVANQMDGMVPPTMQIWGATPKEERAHNKVVQEGEKHKRDAVRRALQARMKQG